MEHEETHVGWKKPLIILVLVAIGAVLYRMDVGNVVLVYAVAAGAMIGLVLGFKEGMAPEEIRKLAKKWAVIAAFFLLAVLLRFLNWGGLLKLYVFLVALLSIGLILLQSGRGGGLAASFGGAGGDSLLGARSATPIAKATYVLLALFIFVSSLIAEMGGASKAETPGGEDVGPAQSRSQEDAGGPAGD